MFSCHYDGCDSESDTVSSESEPDAVECAVSRYEAKKFDDIMNDELNSMSVCFHLPNVNKANRRVQFLNTPSNGEKSCLFSDGNLWLQMLLMVMTYFMTKRKMI
ncbi:hypothetical protein FBUS_09329 [Fasciolopsis buskii]|uniref:Uncharacterized protein n=1 Tax=Fasciolopsis buskii TaxID=27845 RepID=A0A8E0VJZ2_9TREM|nr:hypothetical protein FBUS_09329 [Fasciolopsis buski]